MLYGPARKMSIIAVRNVTLAGWDTLLIAIIVEPITEFSNDRGGGCPIHNVTSRALALVTEQIEKNVGYLPTDGNR